jgi:4-hydroxy-3-polyprenylbenzoate decarboxylase
VGRIVVGVSGASGIILAYKTIYALTKAGFFVDLVLTKAALMTAGQEMGKEFATNKGFLQHLDEPSKDKVILHHLNDFGASIASGSYKTEGMVIVPCSMATLAAVSMGLSDNLIRRAADVVIKERRKLVVVPREAPLSPIHLEHMLNLSKVGAYIVPPVPAWYTNPKSLEDVEDFIVGKILDCFGIDNNLYPRWASLSLENVEV